MIKTAIAFLLGCLFIVNLNQLPGIDWCWPLLGLGIACFYFRYIIPLAFIAGLLWAGFQAHLLLNHRLNPDNQNESHLISGRIASLPDISGDKIRFIFEPDQVDLPPRITLSWYFAQTTPKAGEHWQFLVKLKPPIGFHNPGGFDYEGWMFRQHIGATGYIRKSKTNHLLSLASPLDIQHWRQLTADKLSAVLGNNPALPLILGLTVGNRTQLSPVHWQVLQNTGTSHLMAISGLHIGLAAFSLFFIWRWLWSLSTQLLLFIPAQQAAALAALIGAILYALLAGMTIPTQRALIMTTVVLIGLIFKRRFFISDLLALSLLLVLINDPFAVMSAGFWLSFSAVFLILMFSMHHYPAKTGLWFKLPLWISLGLAPLTLLFFQQTSLVSPIANVIAIPVVSFIVVPTLLFATVLLWIFPAASQPLYTLAAHVLDTLWWFLQTLSEWHFSLWQQADLPPVVLVFTMIGLILILSPKGLPARGLALFAFIPALTYQPPRPELGNMQITVLDVGQGLATVVETKKNTLVFDTGRQFSPQFDAGSAVVVPYLKHRGITHLDMLIISHNDLDHSGGSSSILSAMPVNEVKSSATKDFLSSTPCISGQSWSWDEVEFEILNPEQSQQGSDNNRSCVLKVSSHQFSVLFTGDIEQASEQKLIQTQGNKLKSDILIVAHHGSRSSSSSEFIHAVSPQIASFSLGHDNPYHFPAADVVSRIQKAGVQQFRTDITGAQIYRWQPQGIEITRWREQTQHLWTFKTTE